MKSFLFICLFFPFSIFAQTQDRLANPQEEILQKEGSLISVKIVVGEPLRLYITGKEQAKINLTDLKLTVRRVLPKPRQELTLNRLESHFEIPVKLDPGQSNDFEVTAEVQKKTEKLVFKISPKESTFLQTKETMNKFLQEFTALKKFYASEAEFVDPKNQEEISRRLKNFASLAKQTRHDAMLNHPNFKFSRDVLERHLSETERIFRLGNKSYARWQLASTASVCMSCHTQMPTASRNIQDFKSIDSMKSLFEQAEFLFTTHAFDEAIKLYDRVIDDYPQNKAELQHVESSLERQLAYFSRVTRDPKMAIEKFQNHAANKNLPEHIKVKIQSWLKQFGSWDKQKAPDPKKATEDQILKYARKNIETQWTTQMMDPGNPSLVTYLRVSGILYEYLKNNPTTKATPEILYWLSICDRSISNTFFFSLADLYLKECMIRYPSHPMAKKCYKEYEAEMVLGYTGSSGTHLPDEVKEELLNLKKHVDSGGKVQLREH